MLAARCGEKCRCVVVFVLVALMSFSVLPTFLLQGVDQPLGRGRGPLRQHLGSRLPAGLPEAGGLPPEASERGSVYRAHGHRHERGDRWCGVASSWYPLAVSRLRTKRPSGWPD